LNKTHVEVFLNEFLESLLFKCLKRVYKANQRLSTFFQIDFEIIRIIKNKNFSFGFTENVSKFMILGRNIRKIRNFCKFCRVGMNVQRAKTEFKIAKV